MNVIIAFFRLIRSANLFFIALTQWLFYECIIVPTYEMADITSVLNNSNIFYLIFGSVFIAASGYIINDYFDLNIDRVNKPDRLVVGSVIKRRTAIVGNWILSLIGIYLSYIFSKKINNYIPAIANFIVVIILWFYSTTFKRKPLIGNVIISLLTSWVIIVLFISIAKFPSLDQSILILQTQQRIYKFAILYAGFAFIISLIREIVKDLEDLEGDMKYGCKTLPIIWGIKPTIIFTSTWIAIANCLMLVLQIYTMQLKWWGGIVYCIFGIIIPLIKVFYTLQKANEKRVFHQISTWLKLIMLMKILSMYFIKIYT